MSDFSFKKHKLSEAERLWMDAVCIRGLAPKTAKVELRGKLPKDFNPEAIDRRIYVEKRLTPVGRWLLNPSDPIFSLADRAVRAILDMIVAKPDIETVAAPTLAAKLKITEEEAGRAMHLLGELGRFHGSANSGAEGVYATVHLSGDTAYDPYLAYEGIEPLLETYYGRNYATPPVYPNPAQDFGLDSLTSPVPRKALKPKTAFILMPIDPNNPALDDVYAAIKDACAEFDITAYRADTIEHEGRITDRILLEIETCEYLIADLSLERPNVYYEVGYAHAHNKKPILYRREGTNVHFDLYVHNAPQYKSATDLKDKLRKRLTAILGRDPKRSHA